jgi:hypothetical protein
MKIPPLRGEEKNNNSTDILMRLLFSMISFATEVVLFFKLGGNEVLVE